MKLLPVFPLLLQLCLESTVATSVDDALLKLAEHVQSTQKNFQDRIRFNGNSGINKMRMTNLGTNNYQVNTHTGKSSLGAHDRPQEGMKAGLGDFIATLDGIQFHAINNNFEPTQPSLSSSALHATDPIPLPDVPPAVLKTGGLNAQIKEMQEWFKAFQNQDHSVRDYRKYFKPVFCYLEAAWIKSQEDILTSSYTGRRVEGVEVIPLPYSIMGLENLDTAQLAQWKYRILCYPVSSDLSFKSIPFLEDISANFYLDPKNPMQVNLSLTQSARYTIHNDDDISQQKAGLLDKLMGAIPGLNNRKDSTGKPMYFYHRSFTIESNPEIQRYGFSDPYLFGARTTQRDVLTFKNGQTKMSWAVPLEVIFYTPLHKWNPHNIRFVSSKDMTQNGRDGTCSPNKAFNGVYRKTHNYLTPSAFFKDGSTEANTGSKDLKDKLCVLDNKGRMVSVSASGIRMLMRQIPGIEDQVRTRYPVYPVVGEGRAAWKELTSFRTVILNQPKTVNKTDKERKESGLQLTMQQSRTSKVSPHIHVIEVSELDEKLLTKGKVVKVFSSQVVGHSHFLAIKRYTGASKKEKYRYISCDSERLCQDRHPNELVKITTP